MDVKTRHGNHTEHVKKKTGHRDDALRELLTSAIEGIGPLFFSNVQYR